MAESPHHRRLIRFLVRDMQQDGVEIAGAALPGWPAPPLIGAHRPDVLGWVGNRPVIGEAELGPELMTAHCQGQLYTFGSAKGPTGLQAVVALAVPVLWEARARRAARAAGVHPDDLVIVSPPRPVRRLPAKPRRRVRLVAPSGAPPHR